VPVKIEVLAPNLRALQVTDDLTNFRRDQYPRVKAELSRRYPRHERRWGLVWKRKEVATRTGR